MSRKYAATRAETQPAITLHSTRDVTVSSDVIASRDVTVSSDVTLYVAGITTFNGEVLQSGRARGNCRCNTLLTTTP